MNSPADSLKEKLCLFQRNSKDALFAFLFRPPSETPVSKVGSFLFLAIAYVAGVFHWAWLINFGKVQHRYIDWQMFYGFYQVTQNALIKGSIPYFMPNLYKGTNPFLAVPATDLFPSIYL